MLMAVTYTAEYGPALLRSIGTPAFDWAAGEGGASLLAAEQRARDAAVYVRGDLGAKREALEMLRASIAVGSEPSPQVPL